MKLKEFYRKLAKTKETMEWFLDEKRQWLRARLPDRDETFCPITAVYFQETGKVLPDYNFGEAAVLMGMASVSAERIAGAADRNYAGSPCTPEDNAYLLKLVGLEGKKGY